MKILTGMQVSGGVGGIPINIKTEIWNGHWIRFIEKEPGDWWAVAADVCSALEILNTTDAIKRIDEDERARLNLGLPGGDTNVVSEFGIYDLVLGSRKLEAKEFKRWVFKVLKTLREASGLEGFQIFRMLDKGHQKSINEMLYTHLPYPTGRDYIKLNTVTNKAVSNMYGLPKKISKDEMTPEMLLDRQKVLEATANLMIANETFGLGMSISKAVYEKFCGEKGA